MIIALKCICLMLAIAYGFSNLIKAGIILSGRSAKISNIQMWAMTIGIVGFVLFHVFLGL